MKELLSGNEAIAQGAWEAGARIGAAYPGTPSTETMECFAKKPDVYAEWCTNEKVALEVALGASAAGARTLCTMKHVGVNVAADPLYTAAYTGVNGGMVILAADDPGMYSSQNEQDSHFHALAAHIPCFDPANSQEALDFTKLAYEISERFDVPAMIRSSVRISHTKCPVECGERIAFEEKPYEKNKDKWVMVPVFAKARHKVQLERIEALKAWSDEAPINEIVGDSSEIGIICAGASYQYVREALPDARVLKLGMTYPLAENLIKDFAASVANVYVIEEASEYLSMSVRALGVDVQEPPCGIPHDDELSHAIISQAFGRPIPSHQDVPCTLPNRPPALCAGCPHRAVFKELSRMKAIVTGDIGCYTLGASTPLSAIDTTVDMGASVSMAHGFELALQGKEHRPVVAVIGDSTFAHSGLSSLISTVYNQGSGTVCILDNRTTAMTGRQGNPFNGETLQHRPSREMDLEGVVRSLGVEDVRVVDAYDVKAVRQALKEATASEDLTVCIFRRPCLLLDPKKRPVMMVSNACRACGVCSSIGCPAISVDPGSGMSCIDPNICNGCGVCVQYCGTHAIVSTQ